MIRKLSLKQFGRFSDREFDFAETTVFTGANEAGKTTILDALLDTICGPKKNTSVGMHISRRYGDDRSASIDADDNLQNITPEEFLNLYAVHSGKTDIEYKDSKNWFDKVRASLFSGGIDPTVMRDRLKKKAAPKASHTLQKSINQLDNEIGTLRGELQNLLQRKKLASTGEDRIKELQQSAAVMQNEISRLQPEKTALEESLTQQAKIRKRGQLREIMTFLDNGQQLRAQDSATRSYSRQSLDELEALEAQISEKNTAYEKLKAALTTADEYHKRQRDDADKLSREVEHLSRLSAKASLFTERLALRSAASARFFKPVLFVAALLVLASSGVPFTLDLVHTARLVSAGVLGFSGLVLLLIWLIGFFTRRSTEISTAQIRDEWRLTSGGHELHSATIDGIISELQQLRAEHDVLERRFLELSETLHLAQVARNDLDQKTQAASSEIASAEQKRNNWLAAHNCTTTAAFREQVILATQTRKQLEQWQTELKQRLDKYKFNDEQALRLETERRLKDLDQEIVAVEQSEEQQLSESNRLKEINIKLGELSGQLARNNEDLARAQGQASGAFESLPIQIAEKEEALLRKKDEQELLIIQQQAAEAAAGIFDEINHDSRVVLHSLGDDMARFFTTITGSERPVQLDALAQDGIEVQDSGGVFRRIDLLSAGTRDAFSLAARITLAARSFGEQGVLFLDEPFAHLDLGRTGQALRMLHDFQQQYHWQLVFLTMNPAIVDMIKQTFKTATIHPLEGSTK